MSLAAFQPRLPPARSLARGVAGVAMRFARRRPLEVSLFGGLSALLAVAYVVSAAAPNLDRAPPAPPPAPAWVEVQRPLPIYGYAAPEFARASRAYAMRRHTEGGREDALTIGSFADGGPFMRIVVHRVGGEGAPAQTFFLESARRAAEAGLALDSLGQPRALPTRFGEAEWAEARLAAPGQASARAGCSAFRIAPDEPSLRIFGLACAPEGAIFTKAQMSCLIGGLDLSAAGDDDVLQKFFVRAELARDKACANPHTKAAAAKTPARAKPARAAQR